MSHNPVLPGFHPDPSVCRVGDDFYLATSSFEYFPGVPIFHSRDLVNWRPLGHAFDRVSQLDLRSTASSQGIFAPTLRHHDGRFHLVTTHVGGPGHLLVTARDPAGPWSEPIVIGGDRYRARGGFDPSLFFDDDGRVFLTWTEAGTLVQCELDVTTGATLSSPRPVWHGAGWKHPEGPHLFKRHGVYYLTAAEGGTEYGHRQTVARAPSPWGPFESCRDNPILCHAGLEHPFQILGHADFIDDGSGNAWVVCLGVRSHGYPPVHHLGRETFVARVTWNEAGWPMVGDRGRVGAFIEGPLPQPHPWPAPPVRDDFADDELSPWWNFLRAPVASHFSLRERPSHLSLRGIDATLDDTGLMPFVGRRQQHFRCRVRTSLTFAPGRPGQEAGLTVRMNESHHYEIALTAGAGGGAEIIVRRRIGSLVAVEARQAVSGPRVCFEIDADVEAYSFRFDAGGGWRTLGRGETRYLATEVAGGFTGVYFGLYATGGKAPADDWAHFDWFDYEPGPA